MPCAVRGTDTGWSRSVRPEYRVLPGHYRWSLLLRPFCDGSALRTSPKLPAEWQLGRPAPSFARLGLACRGRLGLVGLPLKSHGKAF